MIALLDVNMLLALLDSAHVHHQRAKSWLLSQTDPAWASCPLTQNGFIRIISQPSYPSAIGVEQATQLLSTSTNSIYHTFWADSLSFLDKSLFDHSHIHGPKQITDAYLLALAVNYGGRLVALDRSIPLSCVRGATPKHLVVL